MDFNRLKTVDYSFEAADGNRNLLRLAAEDRKHSSVTDRLGAPKKIAEAPVKLNSDSKLGFWKNIVQTRSHLSSSIESTVPKKCFVNFRLKKKKPKPTTLRRNLPILL